MSEAPAPDVRPLILGGVRIDPPVVLAPMAGYTDLAFRLLCRRFGAALVYTELVSVDGLVRDSRATMQLLESDPDERPVVAHLYGSEPAVFAEAARMVEGLGRFAWIDINAGCPVPKVVKRGAGAGLVKDPARLGAIVRAVKGAVRLPVTVKTRIGASPTHCNALDLTRVIEDAGADAIALHARYTSERHSGPADWDLIAQVKRERRIPVIGNGGLTTPAQAADHLRRYGVDGIMIGRAAMGNPWLFREIVAALRGAPCERPSLEERRSVMLEHIRRTVALSRLEGKVRRKRVDTDEAGARYFRAHLIRYLAGLRGLTGLKRRMNDIHSTADVFSAMDDVFRQNGLAPVGDLP